MAWAIFGAINVTIENELCHPERELGHAGLRRILRLLFEGISTTKGRRRGEENEGSSCLGSVVACYWTGSIGCSQSGGDQKSEEKTGGKPPVAVEVTKVSATDFTEGIDVVGSLAAKFGADVKSEYAGS